MSVIVDDLLARTGQLAGMRVGAVERGLTEEGEYTALDDKVSERSAD